MILSILYILLCVNVLCICYQKALDHDDVASRHIDASTTGIPADTKSQMEVVKYNTKATPHRPKKAFYLRDRATFVERARPHK